MSSNLFQYTKYTPAIYAFFSVKSIKNKAHLLFIIPHFFEFVNVYIPIFLAFLDKNRFKRVIYGKCGEKNTNTMLE